MYPIPVSRLVATYDVPGLTDGSDMGTSPDRKLFSVCTCDSVLDTCTQHLSPASPMYYAPTFSMSDMGTNPDRDDYQRYPSVTRLQNLTLPGSVP